MPVASPPSLLPPAVPVEVRRGYRAVPAFAAGGRRSVRLAVAAGQSIAAPCSGNVRFAGRVAGGPPVITVDCAAGGLRVTVGGVTASVGKGGEVHAGARLGRAAGNELGLSVRRPRTGYVDPLPLLARPAGKAPAAPIGRRVRGRWRPPRTAHGLRTVDLEVARPAARAAPPDRWLGFAGLALGLGALCLWAWRALVARRARPGLGAPATAVRRAAARR